MTRSPGRNVAPAAGFHDFADHFVAHDARIAHGNGAAVDLVIGAANPAVRHADQHLARAELPDVATSSSGQSRWARSGPLPS